MVSGRRRRRRARKLCQPPNDLPEPIAFPIMGKVILGLDAQADIVELFVALRHALAFLADKDAGELTAEQHVSKGE